MRIALITDGIMPFVTGGMQKHSSYIAKYFTKNNWDVCLYHCIYNEARFPTDKDINDSLFDGNYTLFKINTIQFPKSIKFPFHYLWNSYRYSKIIYKQIIDDIDHFDFILIKGFSGWKLLNLKGRGLKTPPVGINFHGMNMFLPSPNLKFKLSNIIFSYFSKINLSNADYVFSYGAKVTDTIAKSLDNQSKIIEVPTGIDHSWIRNKNTVVVNNKRTFVFVGRNDPLKGIKILNQVVKNINNPNFEFHFVGPIPRKINQKNIHYHGVIQNENELKQIFDFADSLVLPSISEGMPNVILEAMSRGLSIITTDVGANSLMVSELNGVLIKNNYYRTVFEAMKKIINLSNNELKAMKINSICSIENSFTWDLVCKKMINEIKNIKT